MKDSTRINMVAPCGIDCALCELYIAGQDEKLRQILLSKGIPAESIPCAGCRSVQGKCPVIRGECKTWQCVETRKVQYCYECPDFPCDKLHPSANRADVLPHNMKIYNLCTIKRIGVENFIIQSPGIKKRYYAGKMDIGNGPQL